MFTHTFTNNSAQFVIRIFSSLWTFGVGYSVMQWVKRRKCLPEAIWEFHFVDDQFARLCNTKRVLKHCDQYYLVPSTQVSKSVTLFLVIKSAPFWHLHSSQSFVQILSFNFPVSKQMNHWKLFYLFVKDPPKCMSAWLVVGRKPEKNDCEPGTLTITLTRNVLNELLKPTTR